MSKRLKLLIVTLVLVATLGCSLLSKVDTKQPEAENIPSNTTIDFGGTNEWPEYLPKEIPVLQGEIRLAMGSPDAKIRIFYEPLSDKQIEQYVELCQENGFEIEYQIYTREGFPDQSAEKQKAGDYDTVTIKNDDYRMRLEYGEDTATLDIEVLGQERSTKVPISWPEDIKEKVPQPERCQVENIANLSYGGYQIMCKYENGNLGVDEYIEILKDLGYKEKDRLISDTNEIVYILFETESMSVKLNPHSLSSTITFQVIPIE